MLLAVRAESPKWPTKARAWLITAIIGAVVAAGAIALIGINLTVNATVSTLGAGGTATPGSSVAPSTSRATPSPSATPTGPPKPTPSPTRPRSRTGFPDASNTGVPSGTKLTRYAGPCTITRDRTVIDAKTVDCVLVIHAKDVVIKRSLIRGSVFSDLNLSASFTVEDSEVVVADPEDTGIWDVNFTVRRTYIHGSRRGLYCQQNCLVEDSYIIGSSPHASGARVLRDAVFRHNTIWCKRYDDSPDGGCSANLTMYQEFGIATDVLIENNYFPATPAWYCVYGGSAGAENQPGNATYIRFVDNVFARGAGRCSKDHSDGYPVINFDSSRKGNVWSGNRYEDGKPIPTP
jgi:hypothetical protein